MKGWKEAMETMIMYNVCIYLCLQFASSGSVRARDNNIQQDGSWGTNHALVKD